MSYIFDNYSNKDMSNGNRDMSRTFLNEKEIEYVKNEAISYWD